MNKQEAIDSLECFRRNTAHILGDNDEKVKTIETCIMLVREAEETERWNTRQPEIIRCGECKHSFLHDNGERVSRICGLTRMCGTTPDDWFCADAERSEE